MLEQGRRCRAFISRMQRQPPYVDTVEAWRSEADHGGTPEQARSTCLASSVSARAQRTLPRKKGMCAIASLQGCDEAYDKQNAKAVGIQKRLRKSDSAERSAS